MTEKKRLLFRLLVLPFLIALLLPYTIKNWMFDHSLSTIYYLLVSSGMSFGLIPIMYKIGIIFDITDKPGGRHLHQIATPRTGGIVIFITFVATLNLVTNPPVEFQGLFIASSIIALLGIVDDIKRLPAELKLLGQIIATIILIRHGISFSFIPNHFWGSFFTITLTLIWVVGITNAFNFLDGLDGLSSGIAIIVLIFYALISNSIADTFMILVSTILIGSILGFFLYNFRIKKRALIFLGDGGSTFIGFTIAALSIYGNWGYHKSVDLAIPILLLAVPIADMALTTMMRAFKKEVKSLSQLLRYTGNDHFHHRILQLGFNPRTTVLIIYLLTIIMGLLSLLLKRGDFIESIIAISIAAIIFSLIVFSMVTEDVKVAKKKTISFK